MVAAPTPRKSPNSCQGMQSPNLQGRAKGEGLWSQRNVSSGSTSPRRCWTSLSCRTGRSGASPTRRRELTNWSPRSDPWRWCWWCWNRPGGLQRAVVAGLAAAQIPTAVVNPRQVRDFAKASAAGQDGPAGRGGHWPLRHGHAAAAHPSARRGSTGAGGARGAKAAGGHDDHGGKEPSEQHRGAGPQGHPAPHRLAGKGVAQAGRGAEQAHPTESGMAGARGPASERPRGRAGAGHDAAGGGPRARGAGR